MRSRPYARWRGQWHHVEEEAPELAARARSLLDRHKHKVLGTIRADGSPRLSGTEVQFRDGELWIGSMWQARKALDLRRDPRFAIHTSSDDPPDWPGDARISGRMVEITDVDRIVEMNGEAANEGRSHLFRADVTELMVVRLGEPADHLVIETWREGRGVDRREV